MRIEEEIAASLRNTARQADLPDQFAEHVVSGIRRRSEPQPAPRTRVLGAFVTLAVLLVVVLLGAPVFYGANRGGGSSATTQFSSAGLGFTYPSTWHISQSGLALHYERILAFVGTGDGSMTCGSDYIPGLGGTCNESYSLPANSVVVKISVWDGPPTPAGAVDNISSGDHLASAMTVAGYPAVMRTLPAAATEDLVLEWTLTKPGSQQGSYRLTAHFKGPDMATSRSQVDSLIQSISLAIASS